jgi:hydrogenase expression/formation protein HypD
MRSGAGKQLYSANQIMMGEQPEVIFTAFGDMMRVLGTRGSPLEHKARGMDVRIVYSPSDALKLARQS